MNKQAEYINLQKEKTKAAQKCTRADPNNKKAATRKDWVMFLS